MSNIQSYEEIADYFIALSNDSQDLITNLKLQKLVYYAQAWFLGVTGKPIFEDEFQAWVHGPVIPSLYQKYKSLSYNPIVEDKSRAEDIFSSFDPQVQSVLKDVVEEYFGRTAFELERLTHSEDPWILARGGKPSNEPSDAIISKDSMKKYYSQFVKA